MKHSLPSAFHIGLQVLLAITISVVYLGYGGRAAAHPATIAAATATVQPDGHFRVEAKFDTLAFVLNDSTMRIGDGPMNDLLDGPVATLQSQLSAGAAHFQHEFQVSGGASGPGTIDSVTFPTVADVQAWCNSGIKPRLPVMIPVTIEGHLPAGASSVSFRFPNVLGMVVLTTEFPYREPTSEPVEAGEFSTPLPLMVATPAPDTPSPSIPVAAAPPGPVVPTPPRVRDKSPILPAPKRPVIRQAVPAKTPPQAVRDEAPLFSFVVPSFVAPPTTSQRTAPPAVATPKSVPAVEQSPIPVVRQETTAVPVPAAPPPTPDVTHPLPWIVKLLRYVQMGFHHIMPEGLDHILFVLGLFLLSTKLKPLLWQITAFTVAHSLTLALSLYGVLRLPPAIVEPIIAASIAFVAIENLFTTELKPWRPVVVFCFGLVHGMGFAGALLDLGLPRRDFLTALVGFNVGVELGQLSVVVLALLAVGWFRSRPSYRRVVVIPASIAIAAVAIFWTVQRVIVLDLPSHTAFVADQQTKEEGA